MDDVHDSCSMTPPLSPVLGPEMEDNAPFHMESPPKRIHLEGELRKGPEYAYTIGIFIFLCHASRTLAGF